VSDDKQIIVALDQPVADKAMDMAAKLDPSLCRVKVGKELFTSAGPSILDGLHARGFEIFLDLKFHDIPNTVAGAVRAAAAHGVWMINVHAAGGERMMTAAKEAIDKSTHKPLLIAVTVLTSMQASDLKTIGVGADVKQQVGTLASLAETSGLDGVVCSAHEAVFLKEQHKPMTPQKAIESGADYLVIGRSVTGSVNPQETLMKIREGLNHV